MPNKILLLSSVLIIIVTYNGLQHIPACLSPLRRMPENMRCLVIDNGSTDGTPVHIKSSYQFTELIETGKNLGFGAANNIGLRKAISEGYDYVYLLNQDAWIEPEDILKLVDIAERNPEYGIISPLQVYAGKKKIDDNFSGNIPKEMKDDYLIPTNEQKELYTIQGTTLQAAHWLFRVEALKKVGGFSSTFFHYGEDANLRRRMEFHGIKMGVVPTVLAVHNREFRKNDYYYHKLMSTNAWRQTLSDPNLQRNYALKQLIIGFVKTFLYFPRAFFPELFRFIRQLPQIRENRRKSMISTTPFLYEDEHSK